MSNKDHLQKKAIVDKNGKPTHVYTGTNQRVSVDVPTFPPVQPAQPSVTVEDRWSDVGDLTLTEQWMTAQRDGATPEEWEILDEQLAEDAEARDILNDIEGSGVATWDGGYITQGLNEIRPEAGPPAEVVKPKPEPRAPYTTAELKALSAMSLRHVIDEYDWDDLPIAEEVGYFAAGQRNGMTLAVLWGSDQFDSLSERAIRRLWDNPSLHNDRYANDGYLAIAKAKNAPIDILEGVVNRAGWADISNAAREAIDAKRGE